MAPARQFRKKGGNRRQIAIGLCLITVYVLFNLSASATQAQATLTPDPDIPVPYFPRPSILCPNFDRPVKGPTWESVTIGQTTLAEFEDYIETLGIYTQYTQTGNNGGNSWSYLAKDYFERRYYPLGSFEVCIQDNVLTVLKIDVDSSTSPLWLEDLLIMYGEPDAFTWVVDGFTRLAIWFEQGIAAEVFVGPRVNDFWGSVVSITYFLYQSKENYQTRWPYIQALQEPPRHMENDGYAVERNPFDIDATMTMSAGEPSRSPTPTLTPYLTRTPTSSQASMLTPTPTATHRS